MFRNTAVALLLFASLFVTVPVYAQQSVTLTTPILAKAGISVMRPAEVNFDVEHGVITLRMKEWSGGAWVNDARQVTVVYDSVGSRSTTNGVTVTVNLANAGRDLIIALNKANLSTTALEKRIMDRLIADGHITGTVSGTPQ